VKNLKEFKIKNREYELKKNKSLQAAGNYMAKQI
jgi:hypothetical protein